jgi:hypothetical protein
MSGPSAALIPAAVFAERGGRLTYEILNTGTERILFGDAYRLERQAGRAWVMVNRNVFFRTVGHMLEPGARKRLTARIPEDALPGHYRISAEISSDDPSLTPLLRERVTISSEFDVLDVPEIPDIPA